MANDLTDQTMQGLGAQPQQAGGGQQIQIKVDDEDVPTSYASIVRVSGSAEEFTLDFGGPIKQTGPTSGTLRIAERIIVNPYAAKRLALMLSQAVNQYEQTYGPLELDERKRREAGAAKAAAAGGNAGNGGQKLS